MKKSILLFLRSEAGRPNAPQYHSLDTYLLKMYPNTNPRELRTLLRELQNEGLVSVSGTWATLGATHAGKLQGLKEVTIHAHLTARGLEAANELVSPAGAPSKTPEQPRPELADFLKNKTVIPATPEHLKAMEQSGKPAEPAHTEPAAAEPAHTEPAHTEPAAAEPAHTEPAAVTAPHSSVVDTTKKEDLDDL